MSAFNARRDEDLAKLKELEKRTGGRIRVTKVSGNPVSHIGLKFIVRTAADDKFPAKALTEVDAAIQLGARYPFEEPSVSLGTKVFNPNVYTSGRVCLGSKWLATEFLDLLARSC
jgi:ubiquitin-protein ligase